MNTVLYTYFIPQMGPKDPECWIMRAACYVGVQRFSAALKDIERVFKQIKFLEEEHNMDCSCYLAKYVTYYFFSVRVPLPCSLRLYLTNNDSKGRGVWYLLNYGVPDA